MSYNESVKTKLIILAILGSAAIIAFSFAYYRSISKRQIVQETQQVETPRPFPARKEIFAPSSFAIETVIGTGSVSVEGKTTSYQVVIPVNGGPIAGTGWGYCNGSINGTFEATTGVVHGTLSGFCTHEGKKLSGSGTFKGNVDLEKQNGAGTYQGRSEEHSASGPWTVSIK